MLAEEYDHIVPSPALLQSGLNDHGLSPQRQALAVIANFWTHSKILTDFTNVCDKYFK
jgi:hypothetical protein